MRPISLHLNCLAGVRFQVSGFRCQPQAESRGDLAKWGHLDAGLTPTFSGDTFLSRARPATGLRMAKVI